MIHFSLESKDHCDADASLSTLGLVRKPLARDGMYLFRAVSEQVFHTQSKYLEVYELSKYSILQWNLFWTERNVMMILARLFHMDFFVYNGCDKTPLNLTRTGCERKIFLCRMKDNHMDIVYTKEYMKNAAICQSIVYEVLYREVFKLDEELEDSVMLLREQKESKFTSPSMFSILRNVNGEINDESKIESKGILEKKQYDRIKAGAKKGSLPLPYRVAKALDPSIYRNTELDLWEEDRRDAIQIEKIKTAVFYIGDKCQVAQDSGRPYHGHIQELDPLHGTAIVYIEELGQKKTVLTEHLLPGKYHKNYRPFTKQPPMMKITCMENHNAVASPQPYIHKVPTAQIRPNCIVNNSLIQNGDIRHYQPQVPYQPPQILYNMPNPPPHPMPASNSPASLPASSQPLPVSGPCQNMTVGPVHNMQLVSSPNGQQVYPCLWVPHLTSAMIQHVNVNTPASQDPMGQDLPLNDTNTMRFFFNLGVEYYRSVSQMSYAMSSSSNNTGYQGTVFYN